MDASSTYERIHVAGLPVVDADVDSALDLLWSDSERRTGRVYALINGYSATLRRDPSYAEAIEDSEVVPLPDGVPLALGALMLRVGRIRRCPGPDLMTAGCVRAAADGTQFFLLGGEPGVAETLAVSLTRRHPGLRIAGWATPPFGEWSAEENARLVQQVVESGADVLWLGVSAPKQETWAVRHLDVLGGVPVVCVGAAFDFLSGRKHRAPALMRRLGLEWLFRLASEPGRLWRRYLVGNAVFLRDLCLLRAGGPKGSGSVTRKAG